MKKIIVIIVLIFAGVCYAPTYKMNIGAFQTDQEDSSYRVNIGADQTDMPIGAPSMGSRRGILFGTNW